MKRWYMTTPIPPSVAWRKSTRSSGNGNCVEFADLGDAVAVRDTKDRGGPTLRFSPASWRAFIAKLEQL
jgi:hypothetical protein